MEINIVSFIVILGVMTLLVIPMGWWLARSFESSNHWWVERISYWAIGVDPAEKMSWLRYGLALLLSNAAMMILAYFILRIQGVLPLNGLGNAAQAADLAFNTAASFITNTNWQAYAGESSLSNATQMLAITFLRKL